MVNSDWVAVPENLCTLEYSWMRNSLMQEPCLVAAYLQGECGSGSWNITQLQSDSHYTPPDGNATKCQCSWAVYNTVQACASCQAIGGQGSILSWGQYITNCSELVSDTDYYPGDIPDQTAIPFWAAEDPTKWHDGIFNDDTAKSLAEKGIEDFTQESRIRSVRGGGNSGKIAVIVGGTVGGTVALAIFGIIYYLFRRRHKQRCQSGPANFTTGRTTRKQYQLITPFPKFTLSDPPNADNSGLPTRSINKMGMTPTAQAISAANATVYSTDTPHSSVVCGLESPEGNIRLPVLEGTISERRNDELGNYDLDLSMVERPEIECRTPPPYSSVVSEHRFCPGDRASNPNLSGTTLLQSSPIRDRNHDSER